MSSSFPKKSWTYIIKEVLSSKAVNVHWHTVIIHPIHYHTLSSIPILTNIMCTYIHILTHSRYTPLFNNIPKLFRCTTKSTASAWTPSSLPYFQWDHSSSWTYRQWSPCSRWVGSKTPSSALTSASTVAPITSYRLQNVKRQRRDASGKSNLGPILLRKFTA